MSMVELLLLPDRILVNPLSRVTAGYWISHGPWARLAIDAGPDAVADALSAALAESRIGIRQPDDLKALARERLSAAGVRSDRAYQTGTSLLSVCREAERYVITPHANGGMSGDRKGFTPLVARCVALPGDLPPGELGAAVLHAFGQCEPAPHTSSMPNPPGGSARRQPEGTGGIMRKDDHWFPTRRYGWGWGLPVRWQGWLVYGVAVALLVSAFFIFPPATHLVAFLASTWGVLLVLVAICFIKGERPRWRWGG